MTQEIARFSARGYTDGLGGGTFIGMLKSPFVLLALTLFFSLRTPSYHEFCKACIEK